MNENATSDWTFSITRDRLIHYFATRVYYFCFQRICRSDDVDFIFFLRVIGLVMFGFNGFWASVCAGYCR